MVDVFCAIAQNLTVLYGSLMVPNFNGPQGPVCKIDTTQTSERHSLSILKSIDTVGNRGIDVSLHTSHMWLETSVLLFPLTYVINRLI